jgi:hypothetical protein
MGSFSDFWSQSPDLFNQIIPLKIRSIAAQEWDYKRHFSAQSFEDLQTMGTVLRPVPLAWWSP